MIIRSLLVATLGLALALTLSCSTEEDKDDVSSSSGGSIGSSSSRHSSSSGGGSSSSFGLGGGDFDANSQIYVRWCDFGEEGEYSCMPDAYTGDEYKYIEDYYSDGPRLGVITNGVVNWQLPQTIPNVNELYDDFRREGLSGILGADKEFVIAEGYCTEYTEGIQVYEPRFTLLDSDGDYTGDMEITDLYGDEGIIYAYFSKAGRIFCNSGNGTIVTLDIKKNWNKIYYKGEYDEFDDYILEYSTDNILTKEVKWFIED